MTFPDSLVVASARGYTGVMDGYWKNGARELFTNPLAWASYAAWAAVWLSVSGVYGRPDAPFPGLADGLLVAWLLCWMGCLLDDRMPPWGGNAFVLALTGLSAVILWLVPAGSLPILLILLVTQFTVRLSNAQLTFALIALNAYFGGAMIGPWGVDPEDAILSLLGIFAFQIFAVMVMRYAMRSERMAEDLKAVNSRLMATRSLLGETARDQERLRLSRELHDVAGHKLTALKLNLRGLSRRLDAGAAEEVEKATELADELLQDLRQVVRHLRETEGINLAESLHEAARPFTRPKLVLEIEEQARVPRADQAETLLRVVQESLTNAARHGPAETLRVHLARAPDRLLLTIEDDGRLVGAIRPGNGLKGMRERLAELEGTLDIESSKLGGLKLVASLPLELH